MTKSIENLFLYFVYCFDIIIILLVFLFLQKLKPNKIVWIIVSYCCLNSITNLLSINYPQYLYILYVVFTLLEYLAFGSIIMLLIKSSTFKKIIIGLSIAFTLVVIVHFETGKLQRIDSVPIGIETILILLYSFYYLYEEIKDINESFIYNKYSFWIVLGIMIYLGGSFFIYILTNAADLGLIKEMWFLTYVFYILKNIFFGVAIILLSRSNKGPVDRFSPYLN